MKKILIAGGVLLAALAAGFAYYTLSPLFIDKEVDDALPPAVHTSTTAVQESTATTSTTNAPVSVEPAAESVDAPKLFPIIDTPTHPASGSIRVVDTVDGQIVRYENYDGTNGPDLYVYLTNDLETASDHVNLGRSKGNKGNANYEVPAGVDVADYQYVVTWCQMFGVLFDYAELTTS